MKNCCWILLGILLPIFCPASGQAQTPVTRPAEQAIEIRGDRRPAEFDQLVAIWLYPEDHLGKTIRLQGFIFEPENFEYHPDLNGYLFSCEPVICDRNNAFHAHVGKATFLSREKLNFFCSTAEGQRIRKLFKQHQGEVAIPASVVLEVRERHGCYFGDLISFTSRREVEQP